MPLVRRIQYKLHEEQRQFFTPEGDAVHFCKAVYSVVDFYAVLKALRKSGKLEESSNCLGADDRLAAAEFEWLASLKKAWMKEPKPGTVVFSQAIGPDGEADPHIPLAHISLTRQELKIECLSKKRLAATRALVERAVGKGASFQRESARSPEELSGPEAEEKRSRRAKDDKALTAAQAAVALRHREKWIRDPIPALGGIKPVDAARTEEGRASLEDLLKDYENSLARDPKAEGSGTLLMIPCVKALYELLKKPTPDFVREAEQRLLKVAESADSTEEGEDDEALVFESFGRAMALHREGKLKEAVAAYDGLKEAFRTHSQKFQFWGNFGALLLEAGDAERGIRYLETALEIRPDYEMALNNLALARKLVAASFKRRPVIETRWRERRD